MTKIGENKVLKLVLLFFIFYSSFVFAQDLKIEVKPSSAEVALDSAFQVTVTVQSQNSLDDVDLNIPDLNDFDVLKNEGPMSSKRSQLVVTPQGQEFQSSYTSTVILTLAPKKKGDFLFPAFTVQRKGESVNSSTFKIKVLAAGSRPTQQNLQSPDDEADPFSQMQDMEDQMMKQMLMQRQRLFGQPGSNFTFPGQQAPQNPPGMLNPQFKNLPANLKEAFFVQVEVDKVEVFEGEQITVNWYLYTRGQLETLDRLKFPNLKGFWKEIIEEAPSIQFYDEIVKGVHFKKALLASHALFPIKSGNAVIDEYKIKSRVRLPAPGLGGYYGNAYEYTKSSPPVTIKVKPLPKEGRPSYFSGAVGVFDVNLNLETQDSILLNQPFQVKLRIEGKGNAKVIELPPMNLPSTLELYESKSEAKYFKDGHSYKEFQLLFIPRAEGSLEIPPIHFAMFNPETAKYYEKETPAIKITVNNNPNAPQVNSLTDNASISPTEGKAATPMIEKPADLVLVWEDPYFSSYAELYKIWAVVFAFGALALLLRLLSLFGLFRTQNTEKDFLLRRLSKVFNLLKKGNYRNAAIEVINIYYQALALISDMENQSQDLEGLLERVPPSLRRDYGKRIQVNFGKFQALGFAPEDSLGSLKSPEEIRKNISEAQVLIRKILDSTSEKV